MTFAVLFELQKILYIYLYVHISTFLHAYISVTFIQAILYFYEHGTLPSSLMQDITVQQCSYVH